MIMSPESADEYLKLPDSRERDKILSFRKIGILDAGAIGNAKKKGACEGCLHVYPGKKVLRGGRVLIY